MAAIGKMGTEAKLKVRGRPRQFDDKAALKAAQKVFARKGYSATSVDDLVRAMGINRPSLYSAFADKETLYRLALEAYVAHMAGVFRNILAAHDDLEKGLRKVYRAALDAYVSEDGEVVGCMLACTATTEAVERPPIRLQIRSTIEAIDKMFMEQFARAAGANATTRHEEIQALSRLAVGVLHSLAIRARAGSSRKVLNCMADDAATLIARGL